MPAALYVLVVLFFWIALYLYLPTLPIYIHTKTERLASVGVVLAVYGLWQALIRLPLGIAADWLGRRKPFMVAGILLAGAGAWVLGNAEGMGGLVLGRTFAGLAAGTWVPLVVAFSALFPPREAARATSIITVVSSVGQLAAASATGSLNELGGYSLAFLLATASAGLALLLMLPVREKAHAPSKPSAAGLGKLISRRDVLLPALLAALIEYGSWAVARGFLPILAEQMGATDVTQSMLVSLHIGIVLLGGLAATLLVRRVGARQLLYATFAFLFAGLAGTALATSLTLVFLAQFSLGLAHGIGLPVLMGMSIEDVADTERTTAMGLFQSVYALGMFGGPWLSGWLAEAMGLQRMFGVTALGAAIAPILMIRLLPRGPAGPVPPRG
jgi:MFS family permease